MAVTLVKLGTVSADSRHTFTRAEIETLASGLAHVRQTGYPTPAAAADAVPGKVATTLSSIGQQHVLHPVSRVRRFGDEARHAVAAKIHT